MNNLEYNKNFHQAIEAINQGHSVQHVEFQGEFVICDDFPDLVMLIRRSAESVPYETMMTGWAVIPRKSTNKTRDLKSAIREGLVIIKYDGELVPVNRVSCDHPDFALFYYENTVIMNEEQDWEFATKEELMSLYRGKGEQ